MPEDNDRNTSKDFLKYIGQPTIFFYVIGLIITNIYFCRFGILDLSLLRIRYILTGTTFLLVSVIPIVLLLGSSCLGLMARRIAKINIYSSVGVFILIAMAFNVGLLIISLWLPDILGMPYKPLPLSYLQVFEIYSETKGFLFFCLALLCYLGKEITANFSSERKLFLKSYLFVLGTCCVVLIALSIIHYTTYIYPNIKMWFGGGKPRKVEMFIKEEGFDVVDKFELLRKGNILEGQLIHEDSNNYFLIPPSCISKDIKEKTIEVKSIRFLKSFVEGIRYIKEDSELIESR